MNSKFKMTESLTAVHTHTHTHTHTDSLENKKIIKIEKDRNIMLISKLDIG